MALAKEIQLRKNEIAQPIETIYFGGGTPSLLSINELEFLIEEIYTNFNVIDNPEITLEANPDDLSEEKVKELSSTKINRLSIGVQSFFEDDLLLMNRAHNANEAKKCLSLATKLFDNITIDLIYGIPGMSLDKWEKNIDIALGFGINHISSYALTVEPKTALEKLIEKGEITAPKDELANKHFQLLVKKLTDNGFVHYELSNFGKLDFFSKHNTSYWLGKEYLGLGPSAHSFNGIKRSWNVSNNSKYIKSIQENLLPIERETLSTSNQFNEYVMTGLRTIFGINLDRVQALYGQTYLEYLVKQSNRFVDQGLLEFSRGKLITTQKGKFLCDGIAADLFWVD